ncbi:MAG: hypothetical protein ACI4EA_02270 [Candidatus Ornithomonoglobus sp.]
MMCLARTVKNKTTWKCLLCFTVLYIMMFAVNNGSFAKLMCEMSVQILDTMFGYSAETAYQTIADFGDDGSTAYFQTLKLDCIFPLTYMVFLVCLIGFLLNKFVKANGIWDLLIYIHVVAMIFDCVENGMIFVMISSFLEEVIWAKIVWSVATSTKLLFSVLSVLSAVGIVIFGFKNQYIDPEILKCVKGGSYAYCDEDGNYYRSGFDLSY